MKRIILATLGILMFALLFVVFVFPKLTYYSITPNIAGGCFDLCENSHKITCTGDVTDFKDSFAACHYICIGEYSNTCDAKK